MPVRRPRTALLTGAATVVAAAMLAACTSSGGGSPSSASASGADPGAGLSQSKANSALLTDSEIGSGLTRTTEQAPATNFPCTPDSPPLDTAVPPKVKAKTTFVNALGDQQVTEEIANYGDSATVAKALAYGTKGLDCHQGSVGDIDVIIDGPLDISSSFTTRLDAVTAWSITSATAKESLIVAHLGPQLIVLTFGATAGSLPSTTVASVTEAALTKVVKAAS